MLYSYLSIRVGQRRGGGQEMITVASKEVIRTVAEVICEKKVGGLHIRCFVRPTIKSFRVSTQRDEALST